MLLVSDEPYTAVLDVTLNKRNINDCGMYAGPDAVMAYRPACSVTWLEANEVETPSKLPVFAVLSTRVNQPPDTLVPPPVLDG